MEFCKYYANGNDFVIAKFNNKNYDFSSLAKKLCNRYKGIGADGFIAIFKEENKEYDFSWAFFNQDSSEAFMCANGARAAACFAFNELKLDKKFTFSTKAGLIKAEIFDDDYVQIKLSKAQIISENIKEFNANWFLIDTGVPHLLTFELEYDENMAIFLRQKYDANINYAKLKEGALYVRTYERGVGETLACGTGMSACFYIANKLKMLGSFAKVYPKSLELCEFNLINNEIFFKAQVKKIFSCNIEI
ncbi:diaminopimelate epimerase [Campylobacter canadensis]|uniref:Diaminopimelate epimerase n=1 Tax=Campylobacter canadensis TaxID=449520 RepID=A0ABS7WST6_9BACT|nr:diaminopimelate epimerase [Campylobacter canadensis]MBZ7987841.1 diaminopimelate epimerase [Campylobacter canadensis]MBZ7995214.1 diaminopimelate epimerase [Campylobacter canadensis]MBZ7998850.1 diaminopimelate epimerase [Campylobacter canadensis]MBZ8003524.1 diaminopimelate epimerase [Campylobacter canadensis]